jgi:hypothetical protein
MAIDTRAKRSSVIGVGLPVPSLLPTVDGTIAASDRQWLAWLYSGIAASVPVDAYEQVYSAIVRIRRTAGATVAIRQTMTATVEL